MLTDVGGRVEDPVKVGTDEDGCVDDCTSVDGVDCGVELVSGDKEVGTVDIKVDDGGCVVEALVVDSVGGTVEGRIDDGDCVVEVLMVDSVGGTVEGER